MSCDPPAIVVLLVISNLEYGGAQRQVIEVANNMDPEKYDVHVCSLSSYVPLGEKLRDSTRRLHVIEKRFKFDVSVVPRLAGLLRRLNADVAHSYLFDAEIATRLAGKMAKTPLIVGSERNTNYRLKRRQLAAYRITRRCVDVIIANSQAGAEFNCRTLGNNWGQYRVVRNGVDTTRFSPGDSGEIRSQLGIEEGLQIVGMFGSFKQQKNHPLLLAAARRVIQKQDKVRFLFVGDELYAGMHGSDQYKQGIDRMVDELGLRDSCIFAGNRDDVETLYRACDLTVLPSLFEGTPNVALESMACGVPVIATDVSDNAQVIPDGEVGFIVPLGDDEMLANRIECLLSDSAFRQQMGERARQWAEAEFSTRRLAERTADVYTEGLLSKQGGAGIAMKYSNDPSTMESPVEIRPYPYPYKAMLAICSDLDETPDRHVYWQIAKFLNTTEDTAMGPGVGLEVGNTIYFDMPDDQFAYWNTDDAGRDMVRSLIRSGHIDCLHSFGDLATTREHAGKAIDELVKHDCYIDTWVDHGTAVTNFGQDIMCGQGDVPDSPCYHADLTCGYGVRNVWVGRTTSVLGQEVRRSLGGIYDSNHVQASAKTVLKEATKGFLARLGNKKYAMHAANRVLRPCTLRDGQSVSEFMRSNPHWGGVSSCDTGRAIDQVLTKQMLSRLVDRQGVCILYTHLGKIDNPKKPFSDAAVAAFHALAEMRRQGDILVTTTSRLLNFLRLKAEIHWDTSDDGETVTINLQCCGEPQKHTSDDVTRAVQGVTFYVPRDRGIRIQVLGHSLPTQENAPDQTGRRSVSVEFPSLHFPI